MTLGRASMLGLGGAAVALLAVGGIASSPAPDQLPTVEVWHNPT